MFDVYYKRGLELSTVRKLLDEGANTAYPSTLALVAIHSSIAFSDALLSKFDCKRSSTQDHRTASDDVETCCKAQKLNTLGLKHLKELLSKKTPYSYGSSDVTAEQAAFISTKAERFQAWIEQCLGRER